MAVQQHTPERYSDKDASHDLVTATTQTRREHVRRERTNFPKSTSEVPTYRLEEVVRNWVHTILPSLGSLLLLLLSVNIVFRRGIENVEEALSGVADLEHTGEVTASITVVWCRPNRAQSIIV